MLGLGWQTYWQLVGDVLSPTRVRRAVVIGVVAAIAAGGAITALEVAFHWTGRGAAGASVIVVVLSIGVGLVVFACCPFARPVDPAATINGRQVRADTARTVRWSVQPYLSRKLPPITPEDRDAVLVDTALYRRGVVVDLTRGTPLLLGGLCAGVVGMAQGVPTPFVFLMLVYCGNLVAFLQRLGRAERARRAAETLWPRDLPPSAPPYGRTPNGSKVRLPGD